MQQRNWNHENEKRKTLEETVSLFMGFSDSIQNYIIEFLKSKVKEN